MAGKHPPYPQGGTFAELLQWHMDFGTRSDGHPEKKGKKWTRKELGVKVEERNAPTENSGRKVGYWLDGTNPAHYFDRIERALFGNNEVFAAWREDLRAAYEAIGVDAAAADNIPLPPSHFLGRDQDLAAILTVLLAPQPTRAILVQGGPGIGKTSLTLKVAEDPEVIAQFGRANRWFVPLETATTAVALGDAVARAIGADPAKGLPTTLAALARRPGLLILDNLETPWDPPDERRATEQMLQALAGIAGVVLLASFRGRDRVAGPSWALIHGVDQLPAPLDGDLFHQIAAAPFAGDPDLPRFLAALGGIPLAIELVAARAYGYASLAPLWAEWTRIGADLAQHPDFSGGRLTSLPHSIALSLGSHRMTGAAHRLFALLGQLPAGLVAEDRDALLGTEGFDAEDRLRRIGLAVERGGRLDLLPPIRDHAARHHRPQPADQTAWPAYFLDLTRRLGETIGFESGAGALDRLAPELPNIEAAFRAVLAAHCRPDAMAALGGFMRMTSMGSLPTPVLAELAQACHADGDDLGKAYCILGLGDIALRRTDYEVASKASDEALPLFRKAGPIPASILGEANCIKNLGDIALRRADDEGASKAYDEALPLYRKVDSILGEANCIFSLGNIALRRTDREGTRKAYKAYEEALPLYRQEGDVLGKANCIFRFGDIALARTDREGARKAYEEARTLYRAAEYPPGEAACAEKLDHLTSSGGGDPTGQAGA